MNKNPNNSKSKKTKNDPKEKTLKINEEIPIDLIQKIPTILKAIEDFEGRNVLSSKQIAYRGPLPPQILTDLNEEQKNKLIDNMTEEHKRADEFQEKSLNAILNDKISSRKNSNFRLIYLSLLFFGIFIFCVFTDSINFLKDLLPYLSIFIGGGGATILFFQLKKNQKNIENFFDDSEN